MMIRRLAARYDFGGIPRDQWRKSLGALSEAESTWLRRRIRIYTIYRCFRGVVLLPVSIVRAAANLWRLSDEIERLHRAPYRRACVGKGCVVDVQTWLVNGPNIQLGDFVKISAFSSVIAGKVSTIRIGSNSIIGPGVTIVSLNHGMAMSQGPIRYQEWDEASVEIGADVWVGANAVILPGTSIGDGCVIGAGAIVKGALRPGVIAYMKDGALICRDRS